MQIPIFDPAQYNKDSWQAYIDTYFKTNNQLLSHYNAFVYNLSAITNPIDLNTTILWSDIVKSISTSNKNKITDNVIEASTVGKGYRLIFEYSQKTPSIIKYFQNQIDALDEENFKYFVESDNDDYSVFGITSVAPPSLVLMYANLNAFCFRDDNANLFLYKYLLSRNFTKDFSVELQKETSSAALASAHDYLNELNCLIREKNEVLARALKTPTQWQDAMLGILITTQEIENLKLESSANKKLREIRVRACERLAQLNPELLKNYNTLENLGIIPTHHELDTHTIGIELELPENFNISTC